MTTELQHTPSVLNLKLKCEGYIHTDLQVGGT